MHIFLSWLFLILRSRYNSANITDTTRNEPTFPYTDHLTKNQLTAEKTGDIRAPLSSDGKTGDLRRRLITSSEKRDSSKEVSLKFSSANEATDHNDRNCFLTLSLLSLVIAILTLEGKTSR